MNDRTESGRSEAGHTTEEGRNETYIVMTEVVNNDNTRSNNKFSMFQDVTPKVHNINKRGVVLLFENLNKNVEFFVRKVLTGIKTRG